MNRALICPLDGQPLTIVERQLVCPQGHTFDRAKQGYYNLLPVHYKRSKSPGDNKDMVAARRRLLNAGCYQFISDLLANYLINECLLQPQSHLLDAGCGEGYYLRCLQNSSHPILANCRYSGIDISKYAVQAAAAQDKQACYLVASNRAIPLADRSVDLIVSAFGFPVYDEFARCLKPEGSLILLEAGPSHLLEIRKALYPELSTNKSSSNTPETDFKWVKTSNEKQTTTINQSQIADLLMMTPHGHRAEKSRLEVVKQCASMTVTLDIKITHYKLYDKT
ncbi:putative RNA methyltransferase [Gayadomonas joobiniege]|uniref:putative RNA methyltransferase n=1 Tax=Gayadomonas joobiniege TaxID=1234606 RepID=UPI000374802A|nr:methyltransferase domain-containing protein [Gayadomonas joobiniege]